VVNAREVQVSGRKAEQKLYRHHSGYPGGLKEIPYARMLERKPDEASRRMSAKPAWLMLLVDYSKGGLGNVAQESTSRCSAKAFVDIP
jgi:large subunit ribosomal protein L13